MLGIKYNVNVGINIELYLTSPHPPPPSPPPPPPNKNRPIYTCTESGQKYTNTSHFPYIFNIKPQVFKILSH